MPPPARILLTTHHRTYKTRIPWRVEGVARVLSARGHEVTVLCTADRARWNRREFDSDGVRFVETPDLWTGRLRSGWDPWNLWHRSRWLRLHDFDLIHAFETRPAVIHSLMGALRRRPIPLVIDWCDWWGRGGLITENRPPWYQLLFGGLETHYEEAYRRRADATTLISRGLSERATALGVPRDTQFWIPNGCWPQRILPVDSGLNRDRFGLPRHHFLVGFTALDVHLGLDLMLDAFATAAARDPDLTLVLTGQLPTAAQRRLEAAGLGLRVRNLGFVAPEDYPAVLGCMDAFLLPFVDRPANHGRWPGRLNDYLCAGRPTITQPVGEMRTLFEAEPIGRLCPSDPAAIAQAILELKANPETRQRMGRRARELAEGKLSWMNLGGRLEEAYACARARHTRDKR